MVGKIIMKATKTNKTYLGVFLTAVLFLFILPIIVTLWVIPAIILVGATEGRRRSYILGFAKRFGIKNEFELTVNIYEDSQT